MADVALPGAADLELAERRPWVRHYDPRVPWSIDYPSLPLHRLLEQSATGHPSHTALLYFGQRISYRQLDDLANRFANALLGLGLRKGDRVALLLPNTPEYVVAYYGTLKMGGIVVPTNPLYVAREIQHQLLDSGARVIVTLTKFYPLVESVRRATMLEHVIVANIKDFFPPVLRWLFTLFRERREGHDAAVKEARDTHRFPALLRRQPPSRPEVDVLPDDLALLQYTGGTTGVPKGAMLTHANLVANTLQACCWLPTAKEGEEVVLGALPFFHVYGMTVAMNFAVKLAASLVLMPRFEVREVLKLCSQHRPTIFPGVPTMYVAINNCPDTPKHDLRSITACISGAAPLPVEVQRCFEAITGGRLVEGYGLTEAAPVTHCNPIYGLRKAGSIGVPFPDVDAKIVDLETGEQEMPAGEPGELVLRGPQVMRGYWEMPQETAAVLRDGWLYTGDVAKRDENGYFYLVDRKKDVIITSGLNVYPREIDEVLYAHPKVREAVAVGVPDPYRGETIKAFVVLKPGEQATAEEMISYCREHLARYKVPSQVEFRESLPKTMVGKVLRRALLEEELRRR